MNILSKQIFYLSIIFIALFNVSPDVLAEEIGYIPSDYWNESGRPPGGSYFRQIMNRDERFKNFYVRHKDRIDGFQFFAERSSAEGRWYRLMGGTGGSGTDWMISTNECLIRISGTYDVARNERKTSSIFSLQFHLHNGTNSPLFGRRGKHYFALTAPAGEEIIGFFGKEGTELDAIGIITAPSACN